MLFSFIHGHSKLSIGYNLVAKQLLGAIFSLYIIEPVTKSRAWTHNVDTK
jgi:hypothetical protein